MVVSPCKEMNPLNRALSDFSRSICLRLSLTPAANAAIQAEADSTIQQQVLFIGDRRQRPMHDHYAVDGSMPGHCGKASFGRPAAGMARCELPDMAASVSEKTMSASVRPFNRRSARCPAGWDGVPLPFAAGLR